MPDGPAQSRWTDSRLHGHIEQADQIFALSADDDTIRLSDQGRPPINEAVIHPNGRALEPRPEKCLILGWNRCGTTIVCELDNYVAKGSQLTVVADVYNIEKQIRAHCGKLKNQTLVVEEGETTDRDVLNRLGVEDYDHVIVLAYSTLEPQAADAKTLVTLLHLRDMAEKDETPFSIVSEMLDLRNRELAEATQVDDFIVSEHLISLMMAQLSENAELFDVFTDIFDPEGSEIYLKPAEDYVATGEPSIFIRSWKPHAAAERPPSGTASWPRQAMRANRTGSIPTPGNLHKLSLNLKTRSSSSQKISPPPPPTSIPKFWLNLVG
jgi:hypothetical protein